MRAKARRASAIDVGPALARSVARPTPAERADDSPVSTAGPYLTEKLRLLDARLEICGERALSRSDNEAVHDLRVAIRRTRTVLEVGREVLGKFHADQVRSALSKVHRASGGLRDEEVLLDLVTSLDLQRPDVTAWIATRRKRERRFRNALRRSLHAGALDRPRALLEALLVFPIKPSRERRLVKFARRAVEDAQRVALRSFDPSLDDATKLHDLRVAYKRLRYAAELFLGVLPPSLGVSLARTAARWQSLLGAIHDLDVAMASVRRARGLTSSGRDALVHALAEIRQGRVRALAHKLDRAIAPSAQAVGTDSLRKTSVI